MARQRTWLDYFYLFVVFRKLQRALLILVIFTIATSMTLLHLTRYHMYRIDPQQVQGDVVYALEPGHPLKYWVETSDTQSWNLKSDWAPLEAHLASRNPWPNAQWWVPKASTMSLSSLRYPYCPELIAGDPRILKHAREFMSDHFPLIRSDVDYVEQTRNCSRFLKERGYIMDASETERAFPLAFSLLFYKDIEQMERLLRAVYRPHNLYCIHLDKKSPYSTWRALRSLVGCLPNVQIASEPVPVRWGMFGVLHPELICMRDLWGNKTWRYFINLTGQEYPLKTNLQLVNILSALNGSNDVDSSLNKKWGYRWAKNLPAPHGVVPRKGNVHVAVSRHFVDYVLHSVVSQDLQDWVNSTLIPDETFFATLNHNPHLRVPGSYLGFPETDPKRKPYLSRFKNWGVGWVDSKGRYIFQWPCNGKRVRTICIFGVGDLPLLTSRWEMFANKFYRDFEPLALDCLEEWLWNVTLQEYSGKVALDLSFYKSLDVVKNHVDELDRSWTVLEQQALMAGENFGLLSAEG